MLRRLLCASAVLVILTACPTTEAPRPQPLAAQPEEAAARAIEQLRRLVNAENFKLLGFDTLEEVKQAKLGPPLELFNIGLGPLKDYKPGQDAAALLSKSSASVYPVLVKDQTRSSVTIVRKEGGYEPSSFGNAEVMKRIMAVRNKEGAAVAFIVRVPALSYYFLGTGAGAELRLTPIVDDPRTGLHAGEAQPAGAVVSQLVPLARAYNGLPN